MSEGDLELTTAVLRNIHAFKSLGGIRLGSLLDVRCGQSLRSSHVEVTITDSVIDSNDLGGILMAAITPNSRLTVENSLIVDNRSQGISNLVFEIGPPMGMEQVTVRSNLIAHNGAEGLVIWGALHITPYVLYGISCIPQFSALYLCMGVPAPAPKSILEELEFLLRGRSFWECKSIGLLPLS